MNLVTKTNRRGFLFSLAALAAAPRALAAVPLPGDSVYQLQPRLTDQEGRAFDWSTLRGRPVLASMFYASCDMVCPMIFETIQWTLKALPVDEQAQMRVLLVSFDPARDTAPVLKDLARRHGCDARWTLARCDGDTTARKVAAALGVQYRRLASGEFNHSSSIELLDPQGRIAARSGKLGAVDPALVKAIRQAAAAAS